MATTGYCITIDGESAQIRTAAELVVALDVLQGNRDREVLEQLRPHLAQVITDSVGLHRTLSVLAPEDKLLVIEALGERLVDVLQTGSALRDLLASLAETEVEEALLRALGPEGLRRLANSPAAIEGVLEWVYGQADELALELLGAQWLRTQLRTGYDLSLVLRALGHASQEGLIDRLGWQWAAGLVQDDRDLTQLMRALPADLSCRLLELVLVATLRSIVRDPDDWQRLKRYLDADELGYLRRVLEVGRDAQ
ncbi:MAG: hypothetical protein AB7Y46_05355 [Armatimonadota bacterium]